MPIDPNKQAKNDNRSPITDSQSGEASEHRPELLSRRRHDHKSPSSAPDVSVIIVTYNSKEDIINCVNGAKEHTKECSIEIIILDNCSTDNTRELIKKNLPSVTLIEPNENLGFARGVNTAAKEANGKYILLLNPDTEIFSNAIGNIFKFAKKNPQYGLYGARTLKPDLNLQPVSCLGLPSLWSTITFATGLSAIFKNNSFFDPESLGQWKRNSVREVGSIVGCFLLCQTEHWRKLRGFDETFFMYGEDVDLAIRSKELDKPCIVTPSAELIHEFGKSSETPAHKLVLLYKGKITLIKKHWSPGTATIAINLIKFGLYLRTLYGSNKTNYKNAWDKRGEWQNGYQPIKHTQ